MIAKVSPLAQWANSLGQVYLDAWKRSGSLAVWLAVWFIVWLTADGSGMQEDVPIGLQQRAWGEVRSAYSTTVGSTRG